MKEKRKLITINVPAYNEEENILPLMTEIDKAIAEVDSEKYYFNIIFVDDGSKDKTLSIIKSLNRDDVKYVSFSRNFGMESAILAGLNTSKKLGAEAAILMNADLQDPPSLIPEMLAKYEEGYLRIATRHIKAYPASFIRKVCTKCFYLFYSWITGFKNIKHGTREFGLIDKKVIDAILSFKDQKRFTKGIFQWIGFKTAYLEFNYVERAKGTTKFNFIKLFKYAFTGIDAFSTWLNLIPRLALFISVIFLIYDHIYLATSGSNNYFQYPNIRLDWMFIGISILTMVIVKLLYMNRAQLLDRSHYFIEDSNVEDEDK